MKEKEIDNTQTINEVLSTASLYMRYINEKINEQNKEFSKEREKEINEAKKLLDERLEIFLRLSPNSTKDEFFARIEQLLKSNKQ